MKRYVIILAVMACVLSSCKKESWVDWRLENKLFMENIAKDPNVQRTPTGLCYQVRDSGITKLPQPDDIKSVRVKYTGSLITGNVFDSSDNATMAISDVISGFAEGMKKMHPQARYILYIPFDLAYGTDGSGTEGGMGYIPPYSTLIFDVTLYQVY